MKLAYSYLQQFLPDLKVEPQQLRDDLTMIGHFTNYYEKIGNEIVFDLDIKVNRGDCLGYYGLARDLSVLYNLPLQLPITNYRLPITDLPAVAGYQLPITVTAKNQVRRIMALKITGLKNSPSPDWLKDFLSLHQINSINTLVDLTNFIMFLYGIPNHAFDTIKSTDSLIWELNHQFSQFTTLDGTILKLRPDILMVNNQSHPLSLSFLGGQGCAIDLTTTDTVIEMAVYDRVQVRQDTRFLKTTTEAGTRLEKDLDPELIPQAINHLASLIIKHCGGQISSQLFDYYPKKNNSPQIPFDPHQPSVFAGIDIPADFSFDTLNRLNCHSELVSESHYLITPPSLRPDLTLEEDLVEEVIRFWGYQKIPTNQPLSKYNHPDITPKILYLIEKLKDNLIALGYDEVRSWPLVQKPSDLVTVISTQNSINSEYPYLRQSLIQSLKIQLDQYQRYKLPNPQFFEIGKIFTKQDGQYLEHYSLGIYHHSASELNVDLTKMSLGTSAANFFEINLCVLVETQDLASLTKYTPKDIHYSAIELNSQIITLDANVNLPQKQNPTDLIDQYSRKINPEILWQITIVDEFLDPKINSYRYTFRVSYYNCDDKTAKSTHLQTFNLT